VTLFEAQSQYREKETIWRVFSLLQLYASLAGGQVWRWFAINIPRDLGTGEAFTSDIDIIARLRDFPRSKEWLYKTWEVKVGLLYKDGTGRSLKIGKMRKTKTQLNAYRNTALQMFLYWICTFARRGLSCATPSRRRP